MTGAGELRQDSAVALLTPMSLDEAQVLGRCFDVEVRRVEALTSGSVNSNFTVETTSGTRLFGRIFEEQDEAGAERETRLLRELHALGLPGALPLPVRGAGSLPALRGKPFALYEWVSGRDLCLGGVRSEHLEELGRTLARLHLASSRVTPLPTSRFGAAELRRRLASVRAAGRGFDDAVALIEKKLAHYEALLPTGALPEGLVHGDLFRDNVLWSDGAISALLDFESASHGVFLYDLLVCACAWCYTSKFEPSRLMALRDGYQRERVLLASEREHAATVGALVCLRFATTRLTDFELRAVPPEPPARDYRRFLARLEAIEQGALNPLLEL